VPSDVLVPQEGASAAVVCHYELFGSVLMFWCRWWGLLRHLFGSLLRQQSELDYLHIFSFVASTHFSDLLQILQKSGQFFPKLDQKQEFFLYGPHNRKLSQHNMGATVLVMCPIIQLARKSADICRISAFYQISMGAG
jgi:hypothetical protein